MTEKEMQELKATASYIANLGSMFRIKGEPLRADNLERMGARLHEIVEAEETSPSLPNHPGVLREVKFANKPFYILTVEEFKEYLTLKELKNVEARAEIPEEGGDNQKPGGELFKNL